ncbi:MAG: universal stress protein [Bacteroidales bacterium]|nr:universal stress protein [Bacteroidales bacterium]MCF8351962.1 universal stress protein [Bacteroidales bacterium]MCF8376376.1 universal stress protein [Bacteroidales bacterium]MCF8401240.1 universal stress protein [Bacteroidales bacterium]
MKNFIVAIDFSKTSIHALQYAIDFANRIKASIHMVWVDNISSDEVVYSQFTNDNKLEHKKNFNKLKKENESRLKHGELTFSMRRGKVHIEIAKEAKKNGADMIIAGTHGITGFEAYWIGSNAYRIVTSAPCPVLTIRNDFKFEKGIRKIVFPIDNSVETKQKLPFTVNLAVVFSTEVHILGLYSTAIRAVQKRIDGYVESAEKYFAEKKVKYETEKFQADNITKSIINYAEKIEADMITIMTEQENTMGHVFLGPHAQQLINHSPIPILSLKSKEVLIEHDI